jgi:diguanylate cyclase (GGDEF)-like protein/PAS domain S-box-containing protein/hemerythrin-like metal-binding protein
LDSAEKPHLLLPELEEHHRAFTETARRLTLARRGKERQTALTEGWHQLEEFVRTHFAVEEVLLRVVGYPRLDEHIGQHRDFISRLESLRKDAEHRDVSDAVVDFLNGWLEDHIQNSDQEYLPYVTQFADEKSEPLRDTFELAAIGIGHVRPDGRWLRANSHLCKMLGYSHAELLQRRVQDTTHPDDQAADQESRDRILAGEAERYAIDKRYIHRNGQTLWVHVSCNLQRDAGGTPMHFIAVVEDISPRKRAEALARESRERLVTLIEALPDAIYFKDGEGRWQIVNSTGLALFGLDAGSDWRGRTEADLAADHPALAEPLHACAASDLRAWEHGRPSRGEELIPRGDRLHTFDVVKIPLFEAEGRRKGLVIVGHDVTEQKQTEESLRLAASVFANTHDGVMITDPDGKIIEINAAFTSLTGFTREDAVGRTPAILRSGFHDADFYQRLWATLREKDNWQGEITNRRKDGEVFVEMLNISAVRDKNGQLTRYVGVFADISRIKENQRQLEYLAHYDPLTRLPNRVLLLDRMGQALAQAKRQESIVAVCYLDLDNFKAINDAHGHPVGDRMLADIARKLAGLVRGGDTVARLGGDEFVVLLTDLYAVSEMEIVVARIMASVAEMGHYNDQYQVTASIGVTLFPVDGSDPDTLLRHADQAMYAAKQSGRATYHIFNIDQDEKAQSHRQMLGEIRRALSNGELLLHYQPKVNMRRNKVVGAEALIRWQHPTRGLISPAEFLPFVESSDLSIEIDKWVLREALRQMEAWAAAGFELPISVNISGRLLQQPGLDAHLKGVFAEFPGVDPARLELEILETAALDDLQHARQTLFACEQVGVSFAIDDFGTGYSSLTYLKRLPARVLKIDRSFVATMLTDPEDMAIIEGILGLARAFKRSVVAEGVETPEQAKGLFMLGCDIAQGYGIAKPMSAEALLPWTKTFSLADNWKPLVH